MLDILAPSLPPLPNLFHDSEKMNENGQNSGGDVVEGDQAHNELTRVRIIGNGAPEHDTAHATSHRLQDQHHAANNLETVLENEDNHAATHLARARSERMDPLRDEFRGGRNSSPPRVQIHLTASVLSPQTSSPDHTSGCALKNPLKSHAIVTITVATGCSLFWEHKIISHEFSNIIASTT